MVPFDPNTKTLLEYVKERMAAAEVLQQRQKQAQVAQQDMQAQPFQPQQQHPQQQQQFASVTQAPSQSQAVGASVNGVRQITPESMEENGHSSDSLNEGDGEEEQYQFGLDDFVVSDPEQPSGFDRSPSPLSQTMSIQTGQPFTNPSAYAYPNQQPFIQHQHHDLHLHPNSRPFTSQQHQAPSNLDPALLSLNPAASGTYGGVTITPGQLVAPAQSRFVPPATAQQQYWQQASSQQRLSPAPSASQRSNNKREKSPVMSTVPASKRQRTASVEAAPSDSNSKQKQSGSSNSPNPKSVLKPAQALKPLSESEQVWHKIETEVRRNLALANKAPIGTVQKLFKLLSLYVTEPLNATKTGVREATVTDLSVPPMGRIAILSALKDKTEEQFDTCFVTDPRATVLLADWARDLALLARKGKARGGVDDEAALKMTARPLMEVSDLIVFCCSSPSFVFFYPIPYFSRPSAPTPPPKFGKSCPGETAAAATTTDCFFWSLLCPAIQRFVKLPRGGEVHKSKLFTRQDSSGKTPVSGVVLYRMDCLWGLRHGRGGGKQ